MGKNEQQRFRYPAIGFFFALIILVIILIAAFVPQVKETILDFLNAIFGGGR